MAIIATRYLNGTETPIAEVAGPQTRALGGGFGQLPGIVGHGGKFWDCNAPGLIRFFNTANGTAEQRAMWCGAGKTGQAFMDDVTAFISAIAQVHAHGTQHEGLSGQPQSDWMRNHKVKQRCGYITNYMLHILPQIGVTCRQVALNTGDVPNGWDDGHVALEAFLNGKWRLYDTTSGCFWKDGNGDHTNMKDVISIGMPNLTKFRLDIDEPFSADSAGAIDMGIVQEVLHNTTAKTQAWFERIYQIPQIGAVCWVPAAYAFRIPQLQAGGLTVISEAQWNATYYP